MLLQLITPASPCRVLNVRDHALNWHKDNEVQVAQGDFHLHKYYPGRHSLEMIRIQSKAIHLKQDKKALEFLGCSREKSKQTRHLWPIFRSNGIPRVPECILHLEPMSLSKVTFGWSCRTFGLQSSILKALFRLIYFGSILEYETNQAFQYKQQRISVGREEKNTRKGRSRVS